MRMPLKTDNSISYFGYSDGEGDKPFWFLSPKLVIYFHIN